MTRHLSVRLAWHDNKWNGTICQDPVQNTYCIGTHSLLSERLARDKDADKEQGKHGQALDVLMPEYLPPCFWSSSAFSPRPTNVVHAHPFQNLRETHRLEQIIPPWSVFTWPFRLSLTHGKDAKQRHGQYPKDLDDRVDQYIKAVQPDESLVFFYLNYDNPVSADEYKFAVVGCARVSEIERTGEYQFEENHLKQLRLGKKGGMRNFPTRNWALRVTYDFPNTGVRLPYHEYLKHVEANPDDEGKFDEIKVLIDNATLREGFKYVSEQLNDDCCLYLLYKLHAAFKRAALHGIVQCDVEAERVEKYIEDVWRRRGLYPGLSVVVGLLAELHNNEPGWEEASDFGIVQAVRKQHGEDSLLEAVFSLLKDKTKPTYLDAKQLRGHSATLGPA